MNGKVYDQTLRQFIEAAGSSAPTPGGGSISAISASLGAAMGSMVAELSSGSKYKSSQNKKMHEIAEKTKTAIDGFEQLAQQDIDAFTYFMKVLKMPKKSAEERTQRTQNLQKAAIRAAEVPLILMKSCRDVMVMLEENADHFNHNVISDLGVAIINLDAAIHSAWLTARINIKTIKDDRIKTTDLELGRQLLDETQKLRNKVIKVVMEKLS